MINSNKSVLLCEDTAVQQGGFIMNRELLLKLTRILNFVTAGLIIVLLAAFAMPFFRYDGGEKTVTSLWGYLGFPSNFTQMKALMDVKFLNIATLHVPLVLIVTGVIGFLTLVRKKGIATQLFPLIWVVYGLIGYFTSDFILLGNTSARYVHIAILAVSFIVIAFNLVLYIMEIKSRTSADYMDLDAWS